MSLNKAKIHKLISQIHDVIESVGHTNAEDLREVCNQLNKDYAYFNSEEEVGRDRDARFILDVMLYIERELDS